MVETIAIETSSRINQSSCAFIFPMHSWQDPLGRREINNTPAAQAALDKEWNNLTSKGAWDYSTVREWDDVSREAIKNKTKVHVGKIFEILCREGKQRATAG